MTDRPMQMFNNVYPPEADYGPSCGLLRNPSISSMQHEPVSATHQPHDQNLPSPVYLNNQSINGHASDAGNMHSARSVSSVPSYHSQSASLESTGPTSSHTTMSSYPTREDQASLGNENSIAHNGMPLSTPSDQPRANHTRQRRPARHERSDNHSAQTNGRSVQDQDDEYDMPGFVDGFPSTPGLMMLNVSRRWRHSRRDALSDVNFRTRNIVAYHLR